MNSIICFDRVAEAKNILKSGIKATNNNARKDLRTAAWYLMNKTTYSTKQIEERLKAVADDYFYGLPENYVLDSLRDVISSVREMSETNVGVGDKQSIIIYKNELDKISEIGHDDTERLAFVFLCIAKMIPYEHIYECNSKIYQLAWRYNYDSELKRVLKKSDKRRVGGKEPTKRVNRLCQAGIVNYTTRINTTQGKVKSKSTASATFSVPIMSEHGDIAFQINKPDEDSLVLYYDRYKGYSGIVTCEKCGKPVLRTGRRHKYCNSCADMINHHPEKRDLCIKTRCNMSDNITGYPVS